MRSVICGGAAALMLAAGPALAQDGDDWDFGVDPARDVAVAAVTFENFGVAVRCMNGALSVVMSGLPVGSGERYIGLSVDDGPEDETVWVSGPNSNTIFAVWPRHFARVLARGGRLGLRAYEGDQVSRYAVDLPPSPSAVDQVFQACGETLETARSAPRAESFAGLEWIRRPSPSFPGRARYATGLAALTCTARRDGGLRDCRAESEFPEGSGFGRAAVLGAHRSGKVGPVEPGADIDGRRIVFTVRYWVDDGYVTPPPSRLPNREEVYNPSRATGSVEGD